MMNINKYLDCDFIFEFEICQSNKSEYLFCSFETSNFKAKKAEL